MGCKFIRMYKNDGIKWKSKQGTKMAKIQKYHTININNAIEIIKMIEQATELWEKRGITWND